MLSPFQGESNIQLCDRNRDQDQIYIDYKPQYHKCKDTASVKLARWEEEILFLTRWFSEFQPKHQKANEEGGCPEQGSIPQRSHLHTFVSFHNARVVRGDLANKQIESHAGYTRGGGLCGKRE